MTTNSSETLQARIAALQRYQLHVRLATMEPYAKPYVTDPNGTGEWVKWSDVAALVGEEPPAEKGCNFIQAERCAERWPDDQTQWCGRCLLRHLGASPLLGAEPALEKEA